MYVYLTSTTSKVHVYESPYRQHCLPVFEQLMSYKKINYLTVLRFNKRINYLTVLRVNKRINYLTVLRFNKRINYLTVLRFIDGKNTYRK